MTLQHLSAVQSFIATVFQLVFQYIICLVLMIPRNPVPKNPEKSGMIEIQISQSTAEGLVSIWEGLVRETDTMVSLPGLAFGRLSKRKQFNHD